MGTDSFNGKSLINLFAISLNKSFTFSTDIMEIVHQVIKIKDLKQIQKSLDYYFDCVIYNPYHQTFIINDVQALIMIGISLNLPVITAYRHGNLVTNHFNLENWKENLGKIIYEAIQH